MTSATGDAAQGGWATYFSQAHVLTKWFKFNSPAGRISRGQSPLGIPAGPKGPALFHSSLFSCLQGRDQLSCPRFGPLLAGLRPATIHYSLFIFHLLAGRKFATLSEFRPPPLLLRGEEEERPGVEEKKRLWCKLSQYRASINAPLQGGSCSAVWCRSDLLQHPRLLPLAQRLQSLAGFPRAPGEQQRKEKDKPFRLVPNLHTSPHSARSSCRSTGPSSSVP